MTDNSLCLLCDEEPFFPIQDSPPTSAAAAASSSSSLSAPIISSEDRDSFLTDLLLREHLYAPCRGYHDKLQESSYLPVARTRALRYIILVCRRLNLAIGTAFKAANYLDRFISMNCTVKWEDWMMELLSIACLSIASKMDEVSVPSLHDLQMEDLDRSFQGITIQQMELTVLKMLDWRLACITPYTYVEVFTWGLDHGRTLSITCVIELLLSALLDCRFLVYNPSNLAASALKAVAGSEAGFSLLVQNVISEVNECEKMMREICREGALTNRNDVLPQCCSDSVLSWQTIHDAVGFSSKLHCLTSDDVSEANPLWKKKRKKQVREDYHSAFKIPIHK
ncbi:hypothetical protein Cni_G23768 [Canna indica]|uniref:Cyclin-like domain-containing protein n=1 Tax=Canna indica TaxID=4628 RepID=A0AAQ3L0Y3_9LILI|nr:hypothetical protein Cni_G23768 [Canna indica]